MKKQRNEITPLGIGLLVLIVAGAGWIYWRAAHASTSGGETLRRIEKTGVVRIGYANEAPYAYYDILRTGKITGEAPEIARIILKRMGADKIEPIVTEFGSLIPGLKAGRFDLIAAGMYITPERAEQIDFSNPTYAIGEAFLVFKGNPRDLHSFEDVAAHDSARIGVMGGSVEHGYAKAVGVPDDQIIVFPDYPSAIAGLTTGRVDAVAATVPTAKDLLRKMQSADIELAEPFQDPVIDGKPVRGYGAFGFRKNDDAFRKKFNEHLAKFIGSREHLDLVEQFGFSKETLPGDATAEEIIQQK